MFSLKVIDGNGRTIAVGRDEEEVNLMVAREYQEGDRILLETSEKNIHVWFQVDDAMGNLWFTLPVMLIIKFLLEKRELIFLQRHFQEAST